MAQSRSIFLAHCRHPLPTCPAQKSRNSEIQVSRSCSPLHPPKNALRKIPPCDARWQNPRRVPKTPRWQTRRGPDGGSHPDSPVAPRGHPILARRAVCRRRGGALFGARQPDSTSRATSPWHSAHFPTSNKSPDLTAPEKLLMLTAWAHVRHQTLASSSFRVSGGMAFHSLAAGAVKLGKVSMVMRKSCKRMDGFCCLSSALSNVGGKLKGESPRQE